MRTHTTDTAGRIGQLLLEGWRSVDVNVHEPYDRLTGQIPITAVGSGPDVTADGFATYTSPKSNTHYEIVLHNVHYYATSGYLGEDTTEGLERPPVIPTNLIVQPATTVVNTAALHLSGVRYQYPTLTLNNSATLQIDPDTMHSPPQPTVIYVDVMNLNNTSQIHITSGASLELYIGKTFASGNATSIANDNNNSTSMSILGLPTCTAIDISNSSSVYAVVYAPSATVTLGNAFNFYGAIVADKFVMQNGGTFYFDTNLLHCTLDTFGTLGTLMGHFVADHWWED